MNDYAVNIQGYTNQNGTHDVMIGSDSFAQSVRAYAAYQGGHLPENATTDDVLAFLAKTDAAYGGGNANNIFEAEEIQSYINGIAVNIIDYTNSYGTHDVMIGNDDFAYAVQSIAALRIGKEIGTATTNDVRDFLVLADKENKLNNPNDDNYDVNYVGKIDTSDFVMYMMNNDVNAIKLRNAVEKIVRTINDQELNTLYQLYNYHLLGYVYRSMAIMGAADDNSCECADIKIEIEKLIADDKAASEAYGKIISRLKELGYTDLIKE